MSPIPCQSSTNPASPSGCSGNHRPSSSCQPPLSGRGHQACGKCPGTCTPADCSGHAPRPAGFHSGLRTHGRESRPGRWAGGSARYPNLWEGHVAGHHKQVLRIPTLLAALFKRQKCTEKPNLAPSSLRKFPEVALKRPVVGAPVLSAKGLTTTPVACPRLPSAWQRSEDRPGNSAHPGT